MAKESTHRKKAKKKLLDDGYIVSTPCRSRYGAFVTDWGDDNKRGDDLFTIVDMVAWKKDQILFVQYTDDTHFGSHVTKIKDFIEEHNLTFPEGVEMQVWGHEHRKGFTRIEVVD